MSATPQQAPSPPPFNPAEIGALAHLYRGEMYRSKIWRTRLDATTNWAVVTTGIALSVTYAHEDASPLPLVLVGLLVLVFLYFEGRRYRYFDIWRVRVRIMETSFFGPMLRGEGIRTDSRWNHILAEDYGGLYFHISLWEAIGRRLRRNYVWIFAVQLIAYLGKILIHPTPVAGLAELWERAAIGPIPGQVVLLAGALLHGGLWTFALLTLRGQRALGRAHRPRREGDPIRQLTLTVDL